MKTVSILFFLSSFISFSQSSMSLIFLGDIMGHGGQIEAAHDPTNETYNYDVVFTQLREIIEKPDFAIANLEVTLAGKPFSGYPQFSSPDALARACKHNGIDVLVTANNHTCDRGGKGITRTIEVLDQLNIPHNGSYKNQNDRTLRNLMILRKENIRIGMLNYTYGTNGLKAPKPTSVNYIDTNQMLIDIQQSKNESIDALIAIVHWGIEYQTEPNTFQKKVTDFLFRNGVNIVIGGHPHVLQKVEWNKDKDQLVAYSLGNFVSNQASINTDGGMMLEIELEKKNGILKIKNAGYHLIWVNKPTRSNKKLFEVLPCSSYPAKEQIKNPGHPAKMKLFIRNARKIMGNNKNVKEINPTKLMD